MAEPEVRISGSGGGGDEGDVEMQGGDEDVEVMETGAAEDGTGATQEEEKPSQRVTFVEYASI